MNKLLIYRNFSGIGDWLMTMTVLKMVNAQYPNINIDVNLKAKNVHEYRYEKRILPEFTQQIIKNADVKINDYKYCDSPGLLEDKYDCICNMKYHRAQKINFINVMVNNFNRQTGLNLIYDENIYAQLVNKDVDNVSKEPYVLIQSCSKRKNANKNWKDYGSNNMEYIAHKLNKFIPVIQVGADKDIRLKNVAGRCLSVTVEKLIELMVGSIAFIGLDGFLGAFAAHHNIKQYIVYCGRFNFKWTAFRNRVQLNGNKSTAKQISNIIQGELSCYA